MSEAREPSVRATLRFSGVTAVLHDGDIVDFGRGRACPIRFAHLAPHDRGVPRVAGRFVVASHRVFVETIAAAKRVSIEVHAPRRPPIMLAAGDGFSPAESEFKVVVRGAVQAWSLMVVVHTDVAPEGESDDPPTQRLAVSFNATQERVLRAYLEPVLRGRLDPATHKEVGAALSYHPNSAREVLYAAFDQLVAAGVPMPDVTDKRVAVVEAIRVHRLLGD